MTADMPMHPQAGPMAHVRWRLKAERAAAAERIASSERDWARMVDASTSVATDDEHDPEGSTIAFERAQIETLLTQARRELRDLDDAADRMRAGTYGTCETCGRPIAAGRLEARPATRTCIDCASRPR